MATYAITHGLLLVLLPLPSSGEPEASGGTTILDMLLVHKGSERGSQRVLFASTSGRGQVDMRMKGGGVKY